MRASNGQENAITVGSFQQCLSHVQLFSGRKHRSLARQEHRLGYSSWQSLQHLLIPAQWQYQTTTTFVSEQEFVTRNCTQLHQQLTEAAWFTYTEFSQTVDACCIMLSSQSFTKNTYTKHIHTIYTCTKPYTSFHQARRTPWSKKTGATIVL